ncbi:tRNA adenosine(34) deaminase TadA [Thermodesulfobacteriota bacterium]
MRPDLYQLMTLALEEARKGFLKGEVPVGAVVATAEGEVIAKAHNQPIYLNDPSGHAEILAMREAGRYYGNYRLAGALLVVTLEPCLMCMGAVINARIGKLVFGASDPKTGAAGSIYDFTSDPRLNHRLVVESGILGDECGALIQEFFRDRRKKKKSES